jgi:hypothetical protein
MATTAVTPTKTYLVCNTEEKPILYACKELPISKIFASVLVKSKTRSQKCLANFFRWCTKLFDVESQIIERDYRAG